jgi:antitoxin (DNA-binding transcriptional repressor) of toxin-antitoxin stability system
MYTSGEKMTAVSARAARASISALLDRAEAGQSTLIIRNSRACAIIAPVVPARTAEIPYDPDEVRWYRPRGAAQKIGFLGAANAAFLARPRDERARILDALASIARDGPLVVTAV